MAGDTNLLASRARRSTGTRALALALLLLGSIASPQSASAQDDAYRALAEQATEAVAERRLDEAFSLFRELHAMQPSARTLWSLGRVRYEQERYVDALHYLESALVDARRPLEGEARAEAEALRDRALALIAIVEVELDPAGSTLLVDDEPFAGTTLRLDPGEHRLRVEHRGHRPATRRLTLRAGERRALAITLEPGSAGDGADRLEAVIGIGGLPTPSPSGPVSLRLAGEAGLTLHLQRYASVGSAGPIGELEPLCTAPCEGVRPSGVYRAGVERENGDVAFMPSLLTLQEDSQLFLDYVDNHNTRVDGGIFAFSFLAFAAATAIIGGFLLDPGTPDFADGGWGAAALTASVLGHLIGLTALLVVFVDDAAEIRVVGQ